MEMIFGGDLVFSETGKKRRICLRMRIVVHSVRSEEDAQSQNGVSLVLLILWYFAMSSLPMGRFAHGFESSPGNDNHGMKGNGLCMARNGCDMKSS